MSLKTMCREHAIPCAPDCGHLDDVTEVRSEEDVIIVNSGLHAWVSMTRSASCACSQMRGRTTRSRLHRTNHLRHVSSSQPCGAPRSVFRQNEDRLDDCWQGISRVSGRKAHEGARHPRIPSSRCPQSRTPSEKR